MITDRGIFTTVPGFPDQLVAERYRLLEAIGRGGMGTVWRTRDEFLHREVAVKEIRLPVGLDDAGQANLLERFVREARATARLDHPAIINVYDVVTDNGLPWIVMRLVPGRSLDRMIREDGPLPPGRVAAIGLQILDALGTAHDAGILHRDVTPRNVLVSDGDRVVLTDFGIASIDGVTALTHSGALIGSPGYIAPERLRGLRPGPESDLWSLGATLYFAVEGRAAYAADEIPALIGMVLTEDPQPVRRAGPLASTLKGLLVKDPASRLSAEPARQRLRAVAGEQRAGATSSEQNGSGESAKRTGSTRVLTDESPLGKTAAPKQKPAAKTLGNLAFLLFLVGLANVIWNPFGIIDEGRFFTVPLTCGGVSPETVNRLVPGARKDDSCFWLGDSPVRSLNVFFVQRFGRVAWYSAPHEAHTYLEQVSTGFDKTAIGDEAYVGERTDSPMTVFFRVSNVVVGLYYTGPNSAQSLSGALEAARQMADSIESVENT